MTSKVRNVSGGGRFLVKAAGVVASVALALGIGLATPCTAQAIDLAAPEHSKTISSNNDGTYTLSLRHGPQGLSDRHRPGNGHLRQHGLPDG